jgi:small-conductance mechanosensitive channel
MNTRHRGSISTANVDKPALSARSIIVMLLAVPILVVGLANAARGQDQKQAEALKKATFAGLQSQRDGLNTQIAELEKAVQDLNSLAGWLRDEEKARQDYERVRPDLKISPALKDQLKAKLEDVQKSIGYYSYLGIAKLADIQPALDKRQGDLKSKKDQKDAIESEMNRRVDLEGPLQTFKTQISVYFTILVGLVILGFFAIAFIDSTLRRQIFAGQSGMQFVTLFSLVIAIILFGITGILEGKELAALLGGLSGYILGRTTV